MHRLTLGVLLLIAAAPITLRAQAAPHRCATPEYRQFDFWLGDWDVHDGAGVLLGTDLVMLDLDSCVVAERWSSKDVNGTSLSMYDSGTKKWYQSWYDSHANTSTISGGLESGTMLLERERLNGEGKTVRERTRWNVLADGRVHQVYDESLDDGKTWTQHYEGFFSKRKS
jgi:hypothetical protein